MALSITRTLPNGISGTFYARIERTEGPKGACHYTTVYYADESKANPPQIQVRTAVGEHWRPGVPVPICAEEAWFKPNVSSGAPNHLEQAYADLKRKFSEAVDA